MFCQLKERGTIVQRMAQPAVVDELCLRVSSVQSLILSLCNIYVLLMLLLVLLLFFFFWRGELISEIFF